MPIANDNLLGTYLRDRRAKLDPASFDLPLKRRRTPGLRREEVAQRANVSATWYTWLEQGRGGAVPRNHIPSGRLDDSRAELQGIQDALQPWRNLFACLVTYFGRAAKGQQEQVLALDVREQ